jgi:hypothetical protein
MLSFFGNKDKADGRGGRGERVLRPSIGWGRLLEKMRTQESLRILDIGPTSPSSINLVTGLGHSIYLANLVEEAAKPEWRAPADEDGLERIDVEQFLATHLNFSGRDFDVVMFWDTADYLPEPLLQPVIDRIYEVMVPDGQMLAMFHLAPSGADRAFYRYHLTDQDAIAMQRMGEYPIVRTYNNREVEKLFVKFNNFHFFLGKDNLREVLVTR